MKKTTTLLLSVCCVLLALNATAQSLTPELIYYDFNGSGNTVPNLATSPPPGTSTATFMGGVTQGGSGICQGTLIGTGVSSSTDYLNTGWATNLTGTSWTISIRTANFGSTASLYYIFGDNTAGSFRCFTNGVAGPNNFILRGPVADITATGGAAPGIHMTTFVYDMSMGQTRAYVDGVLVSTVTQAAPTINGTGPFKVCGYGTNIGSPPNGLMDEFRVYNRALTPSEITALYNGSVSGFLGADLNICSGDTLTLSSTASGNTYNWSTGATTSTIAITAGAVYTLTVTGTCASGVDTIVVNQLLSSSSSMSVATCDADFYTPSGDTLTMSGTYTDTIPNMMGCDSVITISYTRNSATQATISASSCGSYMSPGGNTYASSGTYMDTLTNVSGCDSVITINLTINQPTAATISANACDMYTAPSGAMYMASGTYNDTIANMMGCDSVITINLTITNSTSSTISATACGMYILPDGDTAMTSGTYMSTIPNMAGCDSVITSNVTINTATSSTMTASACTSFMAPSGAQYTNSGTYLDTIPNMAGCDSIITITLTIFNAPTVTLSIANNAVCVDDAAMMLTGGSPAGGTYSGPGVTGNSFSPVSAGNGTHAIVYTYVDSNGCSNTASANITVSPCVGMNENTGFAGINLYPNPNTGTFVIDLGASYEDVSLVITDLSGRTVHAQNANNANLIPVEFNSAAGMYIVTVVSGSNKASFQLIRQ
jgi:hypothetical protein